MADRQAVGLKSIQLGSAAVCIRLRWIFQMAGLFSMLGLMLTLALIRMSQDEDIVWALLHLE
jgi:hypothetical protein